VAEKSGADILCECLVDLGVEVVFGYPGGAVLPIYDALYKHPKIKHVLVRHEQGATHMPRKVMPVPPASPASCWSPPARAPPTPSPASPTR
jgi:glyoxylate carboligase